jgi:hypothetical protein
MKIIITFQIRIAPPPKSVVDFALTGLPLLGAAFARGGWEGVVMHKHTTPEVSPNQRAELGEGVMNPLPDLPPFDDHEWGKE